MPTRNVVITEHQVDLVNDLVASGRCQNESEVLREGLHLIETRESEDALRLQALRTAVQVGLADSAAGWYIDFNSSESLTKHLKSVAKKAIASA
jgi:antitoxin ParD1/3/4